MLNKNKLIRATGPQNKTNDIVQFGVEQLIQKKPSNKATNSYKGGCDGIDKSTGHPKPLLEDYHLTKDRERKMIRPLIGFGYTNLIVSLLATSYKIDEEEPKSYKEAMQSSFKTKW